MNDTLPKQPPGTRRSLCWQLRWLWMPLACILIIFGILLVIEVCRITIRSHRHLKWHPTKEAISNMRQLGLALFEFDVEYGLFPDESTITMAKASCPDVGISLDGASSNACFRQLIATRITVSEHMFHAQSPHTHRPDNVIEGDKALEKGECAFAYIPGLSSSSDLPTTPIALFPLVPGKRLFDQELCNERYVGKAVILFLDNTVKTFPVDKSGHVYLNGKDLFDPAQPFWRGKQPDVKWPE